MRTFDEIDEKEQRLSVQTRGEVAGSGVLTLDRGKSLLTLITSDLYHPKTDINGWFDVTLRHGNRSIILRNSLVRGQTTHGTRNEIRETQIFPNIVVFNADALDKSGRVRSVLFRFEKFGAFFTHHVIEHHILFDASKDVYRSLKKLRKNKFSKQYPVQYDFHKADSVYLIHRPPRILAFEALGHKFELHWGMRSRSGGWDGIDVQAEPMALIKFGHPKTIDDAIDEIWIWKRLFCQLAMERLDITTISARGVPKREYADFYLSNTRSSVGKKEFDAWAFRRGDSPLSRWSERHALGQAMQTWFSKQKVRHTFRSSVDRVLGNLREGVSLEDVVTLCSAVESLDEFKSLGTIGDSDLKKISKAAIDGAVQAGITIDQNRIRSVIGMLKHQGLPQRLKALMATLAPHVTSEQAKLIVTGALGLRTIAAHGGSVASLSIPRVQPIVSALSGACVLFDLITSGFPAAANEHRSTRALSQIREALNWMAHLKAQENAQASAT